VAGLVTALLLIGGSLAALDREVMRNGTWHSYDDGDGQSIRLAPGEVDRSARIRTGPQVDSTTGGAQAPAPPVALAPEIAEQAGSAGAAVAPGRPELRVDVTEPRATVGRTGAGSFRVSGDADHDGLSDRTERRLGTNMRAVDSDGDGLPDGWEANHRLNPVNESDARGDADGDGLWNTTEYKVRSNPRVADTDANGRPDGADDTDGDRVPNGVEQKLPGFDPTKADSNGDGRSDGEDDLDGDTLPNSAEAGLGTDPTQQDSNGDGQSDGQDDGDGDGVPNGREVEMGLDPTSQDTNQDGQSDGADDTDGDGRDNATESAQGDNPAAAQAGEANTAP
jgi:hypothetical protein